MTAAPPPPRRAAFLDRDGTLIEDRHFLSDPDSVTPLPNAVAAVRALNGAGVLVAVVTNQSGIARGLLSEEQYRLTAARLRNVFAQAGATIDAMYHCPHFPDITGPCECRKPGTLLFRQAAAEHAIDLARSLYAGDRLRDVLPARALGGFGVLIPGPHTPPEELEEARRDFTVMESLGDAVSLFLAR